MSLTSNMEDKRGHLHIENNGEDREVLIKEGRSLTTNILATVLAALVLGAGGAFVSDHFQTARNTDDIKALTADVRTLHGDVQTIHKDAAETHGDVKALTARLDYLSRQIEREKG